MCCCLSCDHVNIHGRCRASDSRHAICTVGSIAELSDTVYHRPGRCASALGACSAAYVKCMFQDHGEKHLVWDFSRRCQFVVGVVRFPRSQRSLFHLSARLIQYRTKHRRVTNSSYSRCTRSAFHPRDQRCGVWGPPSACRTCFLHRCRSQ